MVEYLDSLVKYWEQPAITDDHGTCSYNKLLAMIFCKATHFSSDRISTYLLTPEPTVDSISTILSLVLCKKSIILCSRTDMSENVDISVSLVTASLSENLFIVRDIFPNNKLFLLTSGTTGVKKLVQLDFMKMVKNAQDVLQIYPISSTDTVLSILPLFHVFGLVSLLGVLTVGGHTVIGNRAASKLLHQTEHPYIVHSVPSVLAEILPLVEKSTVQQVLSAGAPLSHITAAKYQHLGIPVFEAYGLTEACGAVAIGPYGKMRLLSTKDVFLFNNHLYVSEELADCYYGETPFPECIPTGDIGEILPWDTLSVTGRAKEMLILSNGEKLHPSKLEDRLSVCPGIKEAEVYQRTDGTIATEIYTTESVQFIHATIATLNQELPKELKIMECIIRHTPLARTETGKLKRRSTMWKT